MNNSNLNIDNIKVSIIIPAYNSEKTIEKAIRSALQQTYSDFEIIIVDDASTDKTKKIINSFEDSRIIYLKHKKNSGGPAKSINTGIKNSKGDYIAILENDDEWLPTKLEKQLELYEKISSFVGLVSCNVAYINNNTKKIKKYKKNIRNKIFIESLKRCTVHSLSSVLIKKEVFNEVGLFDERIKIAADIDMYIRIFKKFEFDFVDCVLFKKHIHKNNLSRLESSILLKTLDKEIILKKNITDYKKYPEAFSIINRKIASGHCFAGNVEKGKKYYLKSIKINSYNIKAYIYLFISLFGYKFFQRIYKMQ
jgi:glycosyltransferase involved in cell wall biosynthesis